MIHHPHYISQCAEDAQQAVWADGLDLPIAASILPSARVTPVDGGYRISGQFPFASGINHSRWVIVGGMDESDGHPEWTFFLIGPNDFKVVDTWFTGPASLLAILGILVGRASETKIAVRRNHLATPWPQVAQEEIRAHRHWQGFVNCGAGLMPLYQKLRGPATCEYC